MESAIISNRKEGITNALFDFEVELTDEVDRLDRDYAGIIALARHQLREFSAIEIGPKSSPNSPPDSIKPESSSFTRPITPITLHADKNTSIKISEVELVENNEEPTKMVVLPIIIPEENQFATYDIYREKRKRLREACKKFSHRNLCIALSEFRSLLESVEMVEKEKDLLLSACFQLQLTDLRDSTLLFFNFNTDIQNSSRWLQKVS